MRRWRFVAAAAVLAAYALASHWLMIHAPERAWAVAAIFGPLLAAVAAVGLQRRHLPTIVFTALIAIALAVVVARGGVADVSRLYVLQHAAIHLVIGWTFAMTLRRGSKALITALAERVHGGITPAMAAYTRWLTGVWVAYFAAMIVVSLAIYAFAPWPWWSLFCNVVSPVAALTLFVGEYLVRYRRHPEFERASMAQAMRAFRAARAGAR